MSQDQQQADHHTANQSNSSASRTLVLNNLKVSFTTDDGVVQAVRGVDLSVHPGEVVAVVGESGSGKSVTMLSVLGLHPMARTTVSGEILWGEENLLEASPERLRQVRGAEIAMIFQDPLTALNPVYSIGYQIMEMVQAHQSVTKSEAKARAIEMLGKVGIPKPASRVDMYPHEFSGGMRQRAMIAMALSCDPKLIIADEPTTALDVTVQAQILELLEERARESGAGLVLITHDLGVVAGMANRVEVMYGGMVVESSTTDALFDDPSHPYTIGLLNSLPRLDAPPGAELRPIQGQPPSMLRPPSGCSFHPRCPIASEEAGCLSAQPVLIGGDHRVACHRSAEVPTLLTVMAS
jgi:oligopeptide/dipeptide ABC transporter ATP-binding protein